MKHRPLHIHPDTSIIFLTARIYGGFSYLAPKATKTYFLEKVNSILEKYKIELDAWVVLNNHYHFLIRVIDGNLVAPLVRELHGATAHFIKRNLPPLITEFGQRLTKEVTPWDKRQLKRLASQKQQLERELKFASTKCSSAVHCAQRDVLAQFIARHQKHFKPEVYRGLKSAITKGRLTDSTVIISLVAEDSPIWYQYLDRVIRNEKDYYQHLNYIHQNPVKHGCTKKISDYEFSSIHRFIENEGKDWVLGCFESYPIVDFEPEGIVD